MLFYRLTSEPMLNRITGKHLAAKGGIFLDMNSATSRMLRPSDSLRWQRRS